MDLRILGPIWHGFPPSGENKRPKSHIRTHLNIAGAFFFLSEGAGAERDGSRAVFFISAGQSLSAL